LPAGLVVNFLDQVLVQSQSLQILEFAEFVDLIPRANSIVFEIDKLEKFEMILWQLVLSENLAAIVLN